MSAMNQDHIQFSRISKLFLDRDQTGTAEALTKRSGFEVCLLAGPDVADSYNLQVAMVTAARIASRCFPGAVSAVLPGKLEDASLLVWPWSRRTLGAELTAAGARGVGGRQPEGSRSVLFGAATGGPAALRVTHDGWLAKVGPADLCPRLPETGRVSVSGVLGAALAMSELFMSFAGLGLQAARREVALSLWRPDLRGDEGDEARGPDLTFLPRKAWMLGLGHLGNAYLWTLATLPFRSPEGTAFLLNDFDVVEPENAETGLLFDAADRGKLKTRVCADWLASRGFGTRLVERRFDESFRRQSIEPGLAFCGFDSKAARRALKSAGFTRVVEAGLGGTAANFDTVSFHSLPNPRSPDLIWADADPADEERRSAQRARMAEQNPAYRSVSEDPCGRYELAGKSVAVPFVGTLAACFAVSEAVRLLHGGPAYHDLKLSLGSPESRHAVRAATYGPRDAAEVEFGHAM